MIELLTSGSTPVVKVNITLEELGLPYTERYINTWKGDQFTPEYTRLNPNQKVPVIIDSDGPGGKPFVVFESSAIQLYLAKKTGRLLPQDEAGQFEVIQWLFMQAAGISPMVGQLVHFKNYAPKELDRYSHERYRSEVNRIYDVYERRLSEKPYIGGDSYSIVDISVYPWINGAPRHGIDREKRPHLEAWYNKMKARPAVERGMAKAAAVQAAFSSDTVSDDDRDRFFGRGKFARA